MKTKDKAAVKKLFEAFKKAYKMQKKTIKVNNDITIKIEYDLTYSSNYGWGYDILEYDAVFSKYLEKIFESVHVCSSYLYDNIDYEDYVDIEDLVSNIEQLIDDADVGEYMEWFENDRIVFNTWTDWWNVFSEETREEGTPKVTYNRISLNDDYTAIIDKRNKAVKVGCQTISIDSVRELIKEYDKEV